MKKFTFTYVIRPQTGMTERRQCQATFTAADSMTAFKQFNEFARKELKAPVIRIDDVVES